MSLTSSMLFCRRADWIEVKNKGFFEHIFNDPDVSSVARKYSITASGELVTEGGKPAIGCRVNAQAQPIGPLEALRFPPMHTLPCQATTKVKIAACLDASKDLKFDSSYTFGRVSSTLGGVIWSSSGEEFVVSFYFSIASASCVRSKDYPYTFDCHTAFASLSGKDDTSFIGHHWIARLFFHNDGRLADVDTLGSATLSTSFELGLSQDSHRLELDFGDPTTAGGTGQLGLTCGQGSRSITSFVQNGRPPSALKNMVIDSDGVVYAKNFHGYSLPVAKLSGDHINLYARDYPMACL